MKIKQKLLKTGLILGAFLTASMLNAQVLVDENFDGYTPGDDIVVVSDNWETSFVIDPDFPITFDGPLVSSTRFVSPSNALHCTNDKFGRVIHTSIAEGVVNYKMNLFVENDASFDFVIGDTAAFGGTALIHFQTDGIVTIKNNVADEIVLTEPYTHNTWFVFELKMNLETSTLKCLVNGTQIGEDMSISELDVLNQWDFEGISPFFDPEIPVNGWVDDLFIESLEEEYVGFDLGITDLAHDFGVVTQEKMVRARVRNFGATEITSFDITMDYNDGEVVETLEYTGLSLTSGEPFIVDFTETIALANDKSIVCTLSNINGLGTDDVVENNEKMETLSSLVTPAAHKKVFVEEATGTWCGFCPRARVEIEWLHEKFGEYLEAAAIHDGDPMATENYDPEAIGVVGFPTSFVDRTNSGLMFDDVGADAGFYNDDLFPFPMDASYFLGRLSTPVHAVITPEFTYNAVTRVIDVTAEFEFILAAENYKVACVITEDSISGEGSDYNQANYYSGSHQIFNPYGVNYYDLAHPVPAADMVYNHVGRLITPDELGGDIIAVASPDETITRNYSITLDESWNHNNIKIIVLLIATDGQVDNVASANLADAFVGIDAEDDGEISLATAYPNPTQHTTTIAVKSSTSEQTTVKVMSLDGKTLQLHTVPNGNEMTKIDLDLSAYSNGLYIVSVLQGDRVQNLRVIKQ